MKIITSIHLLLQLLDTDLPEMSRKSGTTLHYPDLYKGSRLSQNTLKRLRASQLKGDLFEILCSDKEMACYHQEFTRCDRRRCLTIEDYVAVAYAKDESYVLLSDKGWLSQFAISKGVKVMSLKELEEHCLQRQRQNRRRKEQLRSFLSGSEDKNKQEEEPVQQPIDDDNMF